MTQGGTVRRLIGSVFLALALAGRLLAAVFCSSCGAKFETAVHFCSDCGARIERPSNGPQDRPLAPGDRFVLTLVRAKVSSETPTGVAWDSGSALLAGGGLLYLGVPPAGVLAAGEKTHHLISNPDPYAVAKVGGREVGRTLAEDGVLSPAWDHDFSMVFSPAQAITVEVFDDDPMGGPELMGEVVLPTSPLRVGTTEIIGRRALLQLAYQIARPDPAACGQALPKILEAVRKCQRSDSASRFRPAGNVELDLERIQALVRDGGLTRPPVCPLGGRYWLKAGLVKCDHRAKGEVPRPSQSVPQSGRSEKAREARD